MYRAQILISPTHTKKTGTTDTSTSRITTTHRARRKALEAGATPVPVPASSGGNRLAIRHAEADKILSVF